MQLRIPPDSQDTAKTETGDGLNRQVSTTRWRLARVRSPDPRSSLNREFHDDGGHDHGPPETRHSGLVGHQHLGLRVLLNHLGHVGPMAGLEDERRRALVLQVGVCRRLDLGVGDLGLPARGADGRDLFGYGGELRQLPAPSAVQSAVKFRRPP